MEIVKKSFAGTLESSDVFVEVAPTNNGRNIVITSVVEQQFGEALRKTVTTVLDQFGIEHIDIRLDDRGALDCTIRARVEAALKRGGDTK